MTSSRQLQRYSFISFLAIFILFFSVSPGLSEGMREINSGPYSLTVRGGSQSDSTAAGVDARLDLLNPLLNLHVFATYEQLDSSSGIGEVDSQRYGAGFAVSHTYPGFANVFAGTAIINELNEYFGHAYVGGKVKVADYALVSGSYGFGLGPERNITKGNTRFLTAESADWGKVGVTLVGMSGVKANLSYYLTDPGGENISGLEGDLSYPVTDNITLGVNGGADISDKTGIDRNWRSFLSLTYSFGWQKGNAIDVALDKNSPVEYPHVMRRKGVSAAAALSISPGSANAVSCTTDTVTFTASGGTGPYTWSTSDDPGNLTVISATQAQWSDNMDFWCEGSGTATVTVTDSLGASAAGTVNIGGIF